jgi:SAM-dependent methyltransferase
MLTWKSRAGRLHAMLTDLWHLPLRKRGPDPYHRVFDEFVRLTRAMNAPTILELGSRNVTGVLRRDLFPGAGRYLGVDIHPGEGVDVVGDAHRLSQFVTPATVDAVFSISVFEHLVYPWKAVLELNRVLKTGGHVFVSTHPVWPAHELPWDFWRFPIAGLLHLFVRDTGFEVVTAAEGLPAKMYSLVADPPTRGVREARVNQGVSLIARKTHDYDPERLRWEIDLDEVVKSEYPRPR